MADSNKGVGLSADDARLRDSRREIERWQFVRVCFVSALENYQARFEAMHQDWLFRGQKNPIWKLETSLERASRRCKRDQKEFEKSIVQEFKRHAPSLLQRRVPNIEGDTLEWLSLMQHYGAPTRLLDFTFSFWIALFFAYEDADDDCIVWSLNPQSLRDKRTVGDMNDKLAQSISRDVFRDDERFGGLFEDVPFITNERLAIQKGTFVFSLSLTTRFKSSLRGAISSTTN